MSLAALHFAARHGRWCLVIGIVVGLAVPSLTLALRPWVPHLISVLLFLAAFRIGPQAAVGGFRDMGVSVRTVLLFQLLAPLLAVAATRALGVAETAPALALVLVMAAPSVTGSPHFAALMGREPAAAMRLLLVGTALFPLTAIPVLLLVPAVGAVSSVMESALRLIAVSSGAVGLAFALRARAVPVLSIPHRTALDGAAAILLGIVVVGLMSAAGPALTSDPLRFASWLGFVCAVNFGAQLLAARFLPVADVDRAATAIVAGNRNIALFLVALPAEVTDQILLFIGCYQLPMYLTPMLMKHR